MYENEFSYELLYRMILTYKRQENEQQGEHDTNTKYEPKENAIQQHTHTHTLLAEHKPEKTDAHNGSIKVLIIMLLTCATHISNKLMMF